MKRALLLLPLVAACTAPPAIEPVTSPPISVLRAVPADVTIGDLRKQSGCYFYERDGALVPVTTREIDGGQVVDKQICG